MLERRRSGAPLAALALVLAGWIALRVILWSPVAPPLKAAGAPLFAGGAARPVVDEPAAATVRIDPPKSALISARGTSAAEAPPARQRLAALSAGQMAEASQLSSSPSQHPWRASRLSQRPFPAPSTSTPSERRLQRSEALPATKRLSLDAWVFLRQGGRPQPAFGPRPASLGASQIGVVARYAFAPGHRLRPDAYLRLSQAIVADGESEAAAGLAMRPLRAVPVAVHAELRLTRQDKQVEVRPAAFVTAGLDRQPVVAGIEARGYAQAGYVGGDFATGFADGQMVAEAPVAETSMGTVRVGAGAWGGAQKGASRVDVGPSASLEARVAGAPVRIEANYRLRVAGEAQPGTGFAVTVATGF